VLWGDRQESRGATENPKVEVRCRYSEARREDGRWDGTVGGRRSRCVQ
jgi:hypothetical protein